MRARHRAALAVSVSLALLGPLAPGRAGAVEAADACLKHAFALSEEDPLAPCPGIGPGGGLVLRDGDVHRIYCSMGFIVTDGADLFVSTAGHCVDPDFNVPTIDERVAAHGVGGTFGTVAYQWCEGETLTGGCAPGRDFALIRIDRDKHSLVHREMCAWGGASGVFTAHDTSPRQVRHFGWGLGVGSLAPYGATAGGTYVQPGNPVTQPRISLGLDFSNENTVMAEGPAVSGDSGSGVLVLADPAASPLDRPPAQALGILTHISVGGVIVVQRLDSGLAKASADMSRSFHLW